MRSRIFKHCLITLSIGALVAQSLITASVVAVADNPYVWDAPVTIKRKPKKNRRRPRPIVAKTEEVAPLLTFKYKVYERGDGNQMTSVDPDQEFDIGDQVKMAFTPNQDGYLYVVHRSEATGGAIVDRPHVIFPDPRINEGSNKVEKNREYVVPGFCSEFEDPKDCWWEITPPNGKEFFTVIFSRDEITDLPSKLTETDLESGTPDRINQEIITGIQQGSAKPERSKRVYNANREIESDGIYVRNTDPENNEELVDTIEIAHTRGDDADAYARTRALFVKKRADTVRVDFLKENGTPVDPDVDIFREGDTLLVNFKSNFRSYAYFVNITPQGKKCVIYPCSIRENNLLEPGKIYTQHIGFDAEAGNEVLQVIVSHERIAFLDKLIANLNCCSEDKPCACELGKSASSAADELMANAKRQQQSGVIAKVDPVVPQGTRDGIRARSITLAAGKDKNKGTSYVAIQDAGSGTGQQGKPAGVFEIRLKHK
jgi:hypothetical protein